MSAPRELDVLDYAVRLGPGVLGDVGAVCQATARAHTIVVISDEAVAQHWMDPVRHSLVATSGAARVLSRTILPGEATKSRDVWAALTDWMLAEGCGRDTTVVALGGGVVGDLAGFVAATFMRGVPVVQVPTTLLAMVDASIGGKTAVDTPAGKNLVGAFHQPAAILVDPIVLSTLPAAHVRAGMAEVLKHGLIADAELFDDAARWGAELTAAQQHGTPIDWRAARTVDLIARASAVKVRVVRDDPRERGLRQILNAGHTVAHALEQLSDFRMLHGEAVSVGLVVEAMIAERIAVAHLGTAERLGAALGGCGLPTALPAGLGADVLLAAMRVDKKGRRGRIAFAFPRTVGQMAGSEEAGWTTILEDDTVREALSTVPARGGPRG